MPSQAQSAAAPATPAIRWALAGLSMSMLLSSMGTSIANVALPAMADAFAASFQQAQWIVIAYLLAITALIVGVGRLGDMMGRRRLLLAGIGLFTAASVLCGSAPALWLLVAARAVQGAGAAVMMVLTMALIGEAVPKERTGSAMGMLGTMSAVGTALGPSLGGVLLAGFGWRAVFFVSVPLGIATFAIVWRHLPADRPAAAAGKARFDAFGTLLLALTLAAYALAMTLGRGHFATLNIALLAAAAAGMALFVFIQTRTASPLVSPELLRNPALSASLLMSLLVATVMMATLVVGPFLLSRALGLDAALVGIVMSLGPVISAFAGILAGRLVDRFGAARTVIGGLEAMVAGSVLLSVMPGLFGLAGFIAAIVVLTPGYQLFQAANNTDVMANVPADRRGLISGLLNLSRNLGLVSGASVMGAVFTWGASVDDIAAAGPEAIVAGVRITFAVAALLVFAALACAAAARAANRRDEA